MLPPTAELYALWAQASALLETAEALDLPTGQLRAWRSATAATLHLQAAQTLAETLLDRQTDVPPADLERLAHYLRGIAYHTTPQDESDGETAAAYAPELPELDARLPHLSLMVTDDPSFPDIEVDLGFYLHTDAGLDIIPELSFTDLESLLAFTARLRQDLLEIESEAAAYFPARRDYVTSHHGCAAFPDEADHV
jgi:hypothetical protein